MKHSIQRHVKRCVTIAVAAVGPVLGFGGSLAAPARPALAVVPAVGVDAARVTVAVVEPTHTFIDVCTRK